MKRCIAIVCFFLLSIPVPATTNSQPTGSGQADQQQSPKIDPAKEADIRKLLELTGVKTIALQTVERMEQTMKPVLANSLPPGEYREKLVDLFFAKFHSKIDWQHFLDLYVPIYDRYFSHEEINGLIQFYQTPLGQKAIATLPKLLEEATNAGKQWGQELGRQSMQEVLAEHPDLAAALEAAGKSQQ